MYVFYSLKQDFAYSTSFQKQNSSEMFSNCIIRFLVNIILLNSNKYIYIYLNDS